MNYMKKRLMIWTINKFFTGTRFYKTKRTLLKWAGFKIGKNVRVVGPMFCTGNLIVGDNTFIGAFFKVTGGKDVTIGKNVDISPEVTLSTGSHEIGDITHRAGPGKSNPIEIGDGCWICSRVLILSGTKITPGAVVAAGSVVTKNIDTPDLYAGVPAIYKKKLDN